MYTVIILNKHSSDLLKDYKFLFKPFVDEGKIAFCEWNESGTDIKTAVPDLYKTVKGKKHWRCIVVNTDSLKDFAGTAVPDERNPFDYPSCVDENGVPHESDVPIVRLSHMIGGFDAAPIKEFENGYEYYDEGLCKTVRVRASDLTQEEIDDIIETSGDSLVSVYIEKVISKEISEAYRTLHEKYYFADVRPTEMLLISSRKHIMDDERAKVLNSWKDSLEMTSSSFWERNKYPNNCRFLYHDICNRENSLYIKEITDFWLSILTVAINNINASYLQAYRLYRLDVETSSEVMDTVLNNHLNKLEATYEFIQEQLLGRHELTFEEDEDIVTRQPISVDIDNYNGQDLYINNNKIGLSSDCPRKEMDFWVSEVKDKTNNLIKFMRGPRRSLDKAAQRLKLRSESYLGDLYELDKFQLEDLHEEIDDIEKRISNANTRNVVDIKKTKKSLEEVDKDVRKYIACRMSKGTVVVAGLVALLIYFAGYIPYLISAYKTSNEAFLQSLLLSLGTVVLVSLGGLIVLFVLRHQAREKMKQFNLLMRSVVNNVCSSAARFSEYFTDVCTYMKAHSILLGIKLKKNTVISTNYLLRTHKQALINSMKRDKEWINSYSIERAADLVTNVSSFFNTELIPMNNSLYYFEANNQEDDILLNRTGDKVTSPYKFVSKLIIEREELYDETKEA